MVTGLDLPGILQCGRFSATGTAINERFVRDYEFDYYLGGEREVTLDGRHYLLTRGCMMFKKPGQFVSGKSDYNMYMLTLDFSKPSALPDGSYVRSSTSPQQVLCESAMLDRLPEVFVPYHQAEIETLYDLMCQYAYPNITDETRLGQVLAEFLLLLLSDACRFQREAAGKSQPRNAYVRKACDYISTHYNEPITVEFLARHLSLNENYLIRLFGKELSTTPNQYIRQTRLFYARQMLLQTDLPVESIGLACGFNTPSYFIKCFRQAFGLSPLFYRRAHK